MQHQIENEDLIVTIKEQGAEICSVRNKGSEIEYIWAANGDVWGRHAPILFPIVGKLKDNKYFLNGNEYTLAQHGFARDRKWELKNIDGSKLHFLLKDDKESIQKYPFAFDLLAVYELKLNTLVVTYELTNKNEVEMPFSIGAHPGFNCPLQQGEEFEDYMLKFEQEETLSRQLLNFGLRTGDQELVLKNQNELELTQHLFSQDALVFQDLKSSWIELKSRRSERSIRLDFKGFPYLGIWAKDGKSKFICLEPWFGVADKEEGQHDIFQKEGIQVLPPGRSFKCSYTVSFN